MSLTATATMDARPLTGRIDWVDYGKGICIVLVVMMHSTLGLENAVGAASWLSPFIEWARPFRMPDFFMISGLFLASRIERPWRRYLDTKVIHFAYFYVLWMTIQFALKSKGFIGEYGLEGTGLLYLKSFVEPFGTLWFIYMLAVFFVATKALRNSPVWLVWLVGAALEALPIHTGSVLIDEFCSRFVYFYSGYVFAPWVFAFTAWIAGQSLAAVFNMLVIWAVLNAWIVVAGYSTAPGVSIALGYVGASAVMTLATVMTRVRGFDFVRYCGENSLVIYLAFFAFMAAARIAVLKTGIIADTGLAALAVTVAGVTGPLLLMKAADRTGVRFLFRRPELFRL